MAKDSRANDTAEIRMAYENVEESLRNVGKLLRTTYAGKFMWSHDHRNAVTGLRAIIKKLRDDVPLYDD